MPLTLRSEEVGTSQPSSFVCLRSCRVGATFFLFIFFHQQIFFSKTFFSSNPTLNIFLSLVEALTTSTAPYM
jgi:hypothetical protein